jgi:DNA-binding CsgD family transcriptional regulator/tetratricopeptide (TPR) repeat protein
VGTLPRDGLLERGETLAALDALVADVRVSGEGRLVLVGGEAGAGKSTLLRHFCEVCVRDLRVLWGACEPLHTPRPLGPLLDVGEVAGGELATLLAEAARPHDVVAALLGELRGASPAVLVLEDVHWADEATLDVLMLLAPRVSAVPALVLASYRDDEPDPPGQFRFVLSELLRRCRRLRVDPFTENAVAQLASPCGVDPRELYRSTGGNPFFVTEVLAAGDAELPETVREAVLARARRLSPEARRLLDAVAVAPGRIHVSLLEEIAGRLGERLEECLESGILRARDGHIAFRHELARRAIADATPPDRAVALHRAALRALAPRGGPPDAAALVHHADAAGASDAVLRWAPQAAEEAAAAGAHREAAAQYERALRHAGSLPLERRVALLQGRADECWLSSQFDEAIAAQQEVLACHRQLGDALGEGSALRALSRLLFFAARSPEGEPLATRAVEILERLPPGHELAMAYGNLSQRRMAVADSAGALHWGTRALRLAERLADEEAEVYALTNIGVAELQRGSDEGVETLRHALALAKVRGLDDYAGRAYSSLVLWPVDLRRYDLAERHVHEGIAYCSDRGLDTWRLYLLSARSRLELDRGRWDDAAESAELVLRDPRTSPMARGMSLITIGLIRARRGDPDVNTPLDEAASIAGDLAEEASHVVLTAAARAEVAWLEGDDVSVPELTDGALALARERRAAWAERELLFWRCLAGLTADAGDASRAETWRRLGCPYEAALLDAGTGDEAAVRAALVRLRELGGDAAATAVARRLRERGVARVPRGPRSQTRRNPAGLTARELVVLALLAEGLQNAEIAARLVLSVRTVEHHVAAILRKLGVRTRGAAVAEAARLGLISGPE